MKPKLLTITIERKLTKNYNTTMARVGAEIELEEGDDFESLANEWGAKCKQVIIDQLKPRRREETSTETPRNDMSENNPKFEIGMTVQSKTNPEHLLFLMEELKDAENCWKVKNVQTGVIDSIEEKLLYFNYQIPIIPKTKITFSKYSVGMILRNRKHPDQTIEVIGARPGGWKIKSNLNGRIYDTSDEVLDRSYDIPNVAKNDQVDLDKVGQGENHEEVDLDKVGQGGTDEQA